MSSVAVVPKEPTLLQQRHQGSSKIIVPDDFSQVYSLHYRSKMELNVDSVEQGVRELGELGPVVDDICASYCTILQWNLKYYFRGVDFSGRVLSPETRGLQAEYFGGNNSWRQFVKLHHREKVDHDEFLSIFLPPRLGSRLPPTLRALRHGSGSLSVSTRRGGPR